MLSYTMLSETEANWLFGICCGLIIMMMGLVAYYERELSRAAAEVATLDALLSDLELDRRLRSHQSHAPRSYADEALRSDGA